MKTVTIRDVPDDVVEELMKIAEGHGRSLTAEIRANLQEWAEQHRRMVRWKKQLDDLHAKLGDRKFSDSAKIIRRARDRR